MNILHLTDLHFHSDSYEKFSQHNMINKLLDYISSLNKKIDLVIFSGDLVYKGNDLNDFHEAQKVFLDELSKRLKIDKGDIILTAGNHDMDRTFKSESLEDRFNTKINDSDTLFNFFKNKDFDFVNALKTTENYNIFLKEYYKDVTNTEINDLYILHKKTINNAQLGILSINSSWRSVDDTSNGKLLFPKHLLEEALYKIKDIKCKFIVMHHPIHWFKDFNQNELQALVYKSCNIMFSGHIHESEISTHYNQNNGIFAHVAPASLTWNKEFIGFSIIEYNFQDDSSADVQKYHFSKEKDNFEFIEKVSVKIPSGEEKTEQNRVREKINSKIIVELINAKDLLLSNDIDDDNDNAFIDLFNNPKISIRPKQDISENINAESEKFDFEILLKNKNNYFISLLTDKIF